MPKKILVVEDDAEHRYLLRFTLEHAGYAVVSCENGNQVFDAIVEHKPDLLVLDVLLPGIDGYSLQIKISKDEATKRIPIIVLTGLRRSKSVFKKFPQVVAFMTKPFSTEQFLQNVGSAIGNPP